MENNKGSFNSSPLRNDAKALEDFEKLRPRIENMLDKSNEGKGTSLVLTLSLSLEEITLASWLAMRNLQRNQKRPLPIKLSDVVQTPPNSHDIRAAKEYIRELIYGQLMTKEYHQLCTQSHVLLQEQRIPEEGNKDIDLPF